MRATFSNLQRKKLSVFSPKNLTLLKHLILKEEELLSFPIRDQKRKELITQSSHKHSSLNLQSGYPL